MARRRTVIGFGVRISLRPASGQTSANYEQVVRDAFNLRKMIRVRGPEHMLLSALDDAEKRAIKGKKHEVSKSMEGVLSKFTDINLLGDWFNSNTLKSASATERNTITIPPELKPNHSAFFFEFFPERHTFVVQSYGPGVQLSPRMAQRFFSKLFEDPAIAKKWGRVSAAVIQHQSALDEIFGMKTLKKLTLIIEPPNADDGAKWEKAFETRMAQEKLKRIEVTLVADSGKSIEPTQETRDQTAAALEMGEVQAKGRDENKAPKEVSSLDHPDKEPLKYDPDKLNERQAFRRLTEIFMKRRRLGG